jgi:hypothetical protein
MPLIAAIKQRDTARVEELLAQHPKLARRPDARGLTPLLWAIYSFQRDLVKLIAPLARPLSCFEAAALGDLKRLNRILKSKRVSLADYSPDGWTALHLAAAYGGAQAAELLLRAGADVHQRSRNLFFNQPLHACVAISHSVEIARVLVNFGAAVNAWQHGGLTPLHLAAGCGDRTMVEFLLRCGAHLHPTTNDGRTALDLARDCRQTDEKLLALLTAASRRAGAGQR